MNKNSGSKKRISAKKTIVNSWKFLIVMFILFLLLSIFNINKGSEILLEFLVILKKLLPTIIIILIVTFLIEYFVNTKYLIKYLGNGSGIKGWLISILGGIISTGPMYVWYPLLNDLKKRGMKNGLIAVFLYNRAIKIPLLPLLIVYFGLKFSIILLIVMILVSLLQGAIMDILMKPKLEEV